MIALPLVIPVARTLEITGGRSAAAVFENESVYGPRAVSKNDVASIV
jgi:hypothetical protein